MSGQFLRVSASSALKTRIEQWSKAEKRSGIQDKDQIISRTVQQTPANGVRKRLGPLGAAIHAGSILPFCKGPLLALLEFRLINGIPKQCCLIYWM